MFEEKTYETILDEMLENVPDDMDKREGSIIWDALSPIALELAQAYVDLDMLIDETFADSASYQYLIKRAAERGIFVKEGTAAVLKARIEPAELENLEGTEFNIGELNYTVTENMGDGVYLLTCQESGEKGNNLTDDVIPLDFVEGLEDIGITDIYVYGTNDEEEDDLRKRYFESFKEVAFGGNVADYKEKLASLQGVGGKKVYPVFDGPGTVKCVITTADYKVPPIELITYVQEEIDPLKDGSGMGIAPIGHHVTIAGVEEKKINIGFNCIFKSDYTWDDVSDTVNAAIDTYLEGLCGQWEKNENLIVRISEIETAVLKIEGIADITSISLNGAGHNITLEPDMIPVRGEVTNGQATY